MKLNEMNLKHIEPDLYLEVMFSRSLQSISMRMEMHRKLQDNLILLRLHVTADGV